MKEARPVQTAQQETVLKMLKFLRLLIAAIIVLLVFYEQAAHSREQWQIDRPDPPPVIPQAYSQSPHSQLGVPGMLNQGNAPSHMIPGHPGSAHHINQILSTRIPVGSVLTGNLDSELSSKKSKTGDIFAIMLPEGFVNQGIVVVPPGSKILGTVVNSVSAKDLTRGMPGQLRVGLQSLVFPDGRTTKFHGFIDQNPAHELAEEPKTRYSGFNLGDYGQQVKGMLGSFAGGIGWVHNRRMRGKDFHLEAGQGIAVKVNRTIDLNSMTPPLGANSGFNSAPGLVPSPEPAMGAAPAVPGLVGGGAPTTGYNPYVNHANPTNPVNRRPQGVPGLVGQDPQIAAGKMTKPTMYNSGQLQVANSANGYGQASAANQAPPVAPGPQTYSNSAPNSNSVFHQPMGDPLNSLPDPF